jgi:site-specific DNA-methyltransferase (adenine-specific)/adenine-specific DNA-methyltransferase
MLWDGEKDGWMVKILAVNRLATAADLNPILGNLDYKTWERRSREHPDKPVERIRFVCMGHDPDLKAQFLDEMAKIGFRVELEVLDILRDRKELQFKREAEAKIVLTQKKLEIKSFYPMNLLQKLSLERAKVGEWRELVDSVLIDWNYDGAVFSPSLSDIPDKNTLVKGTYDVPNDAGTIRVKITDLIAESWEGNVEA